MPVEVVRQLLFVRHGESESTVRGLVGGVGLCLGLTDHGRTQASNLANRLGDFFDQNEVDKLEVVTSPALRAQQTAEIVRSVLGVRAEVSADGLREIDRGVAEGRPWTEYWAANHGVDLRVQPYHRPAAGAETYSEFRHRVNTQLGGIESSVRCRTSVLVCHAGVIELAIERYLRSPNLVVNAELWPSECGLTWFETTDRVRWKMSFYNSVFDGGLTLTDDGQHRGPRGAS